MKHITFVACLIASSFLVPTQANAQTKDCPPGLAKKNPACVPPGLAKKGVSTQDYLSHRYKIGEHVNTDDDYFILDDWWEYGLPDPENDELYIRIDNEIFKVASATLKILDTWQAVRDLSN